MSVPIFKKTPKRMSGKHIEEKKCEWEMRTPLPTQCCKSDLLPNGEIKSRLRSYTLVERAPIRLTTPIFKKPVTVYNSCKQNPKVSDSIYGSNQEKPMQLCWAKRLQGLRACHPDGTEFAAMHLPIGLKPAGPNVTEETSIRSLAAALFKPQTRVTGQTASALAKTPAFLDPKQPLVQCGSASNGDIKRQEGRVRSARRKLQEAQQCTR